MELDAMKIDWKMAGSVHDGLGRTGSKFVFFDYEPLEGDVIEGDMLTREDGSAWRIADLTEDYGLAHVFLPPHFMIGPNGIYAAIDFVMRLNELRECRNR